MLLCIGLCILIEQQQIKRSHSSNNSVMHFVYQFSAKAHIVGLTSVLDTTLQSQTLNTTDIVATSHSQTLHGQVMEECVPTHTLSSS